MLKQEDGTCVAMYPRDQPAPRASKSAEGIEKTEGWVTW
jgi:hypothetical protein